MYSKTFNNLTSLSELWGYPLTQKNGQRHFGPLPSWNGPPPKDCEIFLGKIPRDCFEDELVPMFGSVGKIYEMRLMMDFSGHNRGFGFIRYTKRSAALEAVEKLNLKCVRPGRQIGVSMSVDNSRLFVGGLPREAKKDDVLKEFRGKVDGIHDLIMYPCPSNRNLNRGFAFIEFDCHESAAIARRILSNGVQTAFGEKLMVDWAEPEPIVDEKIMKKVKVLYVRNININTCERTLRRIFTSAVYPSTVEKVKKIKDFAFIHFESRADAELALSVLSNVELEGSILDIKWARPVDKTLYELQKFINKGCPVLCSCCSSDKFVKKYKQNNLNTEPKIAAITSNSPSYQLDSICKMFNWELPRYEYSVSLINATEFLYFGSVTLFISTPVFDKIVAIGPFVSDGKDTIKDALFVATQIALNQLEGLLNVTSNSVVKSQFGNLCVDQTQ